MGVLAEQLDAPRPLTKCKFARILDGLDDADRAAIERHTPAAIAIALSAAGLRVVPSTVGLHKRGACSCG